MPRFTAIRLRWYISLSLFCCSNILWGQRNLLLNGGFEDINNCAEYHSECGVEAWFYLNATHVVLLPMESKTATLGSNTLSVYFKWQPLDLFTPVIGTALPCKLQAGHNYMFRGLFSAKINELLRMKPGVALGENFYVPRRPFTQKIRVDTIWILEQIPNQELLAFSYYFTATGREKYLTFGTFITLDAGPGKYITKGSDEILLTVDNFELLADDSNEVACPNYPQRKAAIYQYDFRHKIMDNTLYVKGELPIKLDETDSGAITLIETPKPNPTPALSDTLRLGDVLFDVNKAQLKLAALLVLQKAFAQRDKQDIDSVFVEGHTDSVGNDERNMALSRNRSQSVKDWLMANNIVSENKIQIHAFGKLRPVASNKTPQGRSLNRRVELVIFRKGK